MAGSHWLQPILDIHEYTVARTALPTRFVRPPLTHISRCTTSRNFLISQESSPFWTLLSCHECTARFGLIKASLGAAAFVMNPD